MSLGFLMCLAAWPAGAPLIPLSVCEVLRDLPAHEGKTVAVLGRYSFRETGRWISEQACDPPVQGPPELWLVEEKEAPKLPDDYALNGAALNKKFADLRKTTSLGKFRFGTPDYDRWTVIYGRVEARKGEDAKKAPANLVYRGNGTIVFLTPE